MKNNRSIVDVTILSMGMFLGVLLLALNLLSFDGILREILAALFVTVVPGYAFTSLLLFKEEINFPAKVLVSLLGSIAVISFIAFLLAISPLGFTGQNIFIAVIITTYSLAALAIIQRRIKLALATHDIIYYLKIIVSKLQNLNRYLLWLLVIGIFLNVIAVIGFEYVREEPFTEFYIPGNPRPGSLAEIIASRVVNVAVSNREARPIDYLIEVYSVADNAESLICSQRVRLNRGEKSTISLPLPDLPRNVSWLVILLHEDDHPDLKLILQ